MWPVGQHPPFSGPQRIGILIIKGKLCRKPWFFYGFCRFSPPSSMYIYIYSIYSGFLTYQERPGTDITIISRGLHWQSWWGYWNVWPSQIQFKIFKETSSRPAIVKQSPQVQAQPRHQSCNLLKVSHWNTAARFIAEVEAQPARRWQQKSWWHSKNLQKTSGFPWKIHSG